MTRKPQFVACLALLGVLCVFVAPATDLPDTVKSKQVAVAVVLALAVATGEAPADSRPLLPADSPCPPLDLLARIHTLRV